MGLRGDIGLVLCMMVVVGYIYTHKFNWMEFGKPATTTTTTNGASILVTDFGAAGDGITDDTQAFSRAWNATCKSTSNGPTMIVPAGTTPTFMLKQPVVFQGPCNSSSINVQVLGNIEAPSKMDFGDINSTTWISFSKVEGLFVNGSGQINGNGKTWWDSCEIGTKCQRPAALTFNRCDNLTLNGLTHVDSQDNHISITNCNGVTISNLHINAPQNSPNTDGIDISDSSNIQIHDCYIGTGDDCIAIIDGCSDINITNVNCGPGHGISIGSLGKNGTTATVEDVHVNHCTFNGTQNGARIKTWQGGSGHARNISFEDITLVESGNPIIIDQYYCPHDTCQNQTSAVIISDVSFNGFHGTTETQNAIQLNCTSIADGCTDITLNQINITAAPNLKGSPIRSTCINAHGRSSPSNNPIVDCLNQQLDYYVADY